MRPCLKNQALPTKQRVSQTCGKWEAGNKDERKHHSKSRCAQNAESQQRQMSLEGLKMTGGKFKEKKKERDNTYYQCTHLMGSPKT